MERNIMDGTAAARDLEAVLDRYRAQVNDALRATVAQARTASSPSSPVRDALAEFQGQIEYHFGWRHADLTPARLRSGKLLRPTLLLLACELAAGRNSAAPAERAALAQRAIPAGVCVELVHNFSLVHDDIEDNDEHRHHRATLWKLWGVPQAINTGDGIFAMARLALWRLLENAVPPAVVARLAELIDRTCLELCEGQFLDMRFEGRRDITAAMYLEMIARKTAALMSCAAEMGARLAAPDDTDLAAQLARFGRSLGLAFQLRDDLLGIWAAEDLGKSAAGDLRRKKMSLPIIHALETATPADREELAAIYAAPGPATDAQIATILGILDHTNARARVRTALRGEVAIARATLDTAAGDAPEAREPRALLDILVAFVAAVEA
jgi:geranylgeranyl diphosphate synthase, type I